MWSHSESVNYGKYRQIPVCLRINSLGHHVLMYSLVSLVPRPFKCVKERKGLVNYSDLERIHGISILQTLFSELQFHWLAIVPKISIFILMNMTNQSQRRTMTSWQSTCRLVEFELLISTVSRNAAVDLC